MLNTGFYNASFIFVILHKISRLKLLAPQDWRLCVLADEWGKKKCLAMSQELKLEAEVFMANKYIEIFSGDRPCHGQARN